MDEAALSAVAKVLAHDPEQATLICAHGHYRNTVFVWHVLTMVPIRELRGLWRHLSKAAGYAYERNHTRFLFRHNDVRLGAIFSDYWVIFGRVDQVRSVHDRQ